MALAGAAGRRYSPQNAVPKTQGDAVSVLFAPALQRASLPVLLILAALLVGCASRPAPHVEERAAGGEPPPLLRDDVPAQGAGGESSPVLPLLLFVLITFIAPIADMLFRSVENRIVTETLPRTVVSLDNWNAEGEDLPDDAVFRDIVGVVNRIACARGKRGHTASRRNRRTGRLYYLASCCDQYRYRHSDGCQHLRCDPGILSL